jgi:cell division protein ZapA (FtsZ GTPase activity inhibitor)
MANNKRITISHYYTTGSTQPDVSGLTLGELAIGVQNGNEAIYIKNTNNGIAKFITEAQINKKLENYTPNSTTTTTASTAQYGVVKIVTVISTNSRHTNGLAASDNHKHLNYLEGGTDSGTTYVALSNVRSDNASQQVILNLKEWNDAVSKLETGFTISSGSINLSSGNINVTGSVNASSGFFETSDEKLKTFNENIVVDVDKLSKLRKSYFTFNEDKNKTTHIGVSAQEIKKLYPEIVFENEEGNLMLDYSKLSVIALSAVDALNEKNKKLENKAKRLETRIRKIEKTLTNITDKLGC